MNEYKFTSRNEQDTIEFAQNIESEKFPNMVICLNGELGSGKTVFVKGFASSLGITDVITSPTFNLVKEYNTGELPLYHMDVYRLDEKSDKSELVDYYDNQGVTIIEWAELMNNSLPEKRLDIYFKIVDENTRVLILKPYGKEYEDICNAVL